MTENKQMGKTEDTPPVQPLPASILSHESLIALERHITALLYAIWKEIGVQKRIVRTEK